MGPPLVQPWWERGSPLLQPCRDATPQGCSEEVLTTLHCSSSVDEETGEPVRHCVKLLKRYLRCAGRCVWSVGRWGPRADAWGRLGWRG